jgi:hypothetical protein
MYSCLGITVFFNEFEMLFLQLKTLSRVCDHIIIVEAECNARGELRDKLEFNQFLERFGDRVRDISYEYLRVPQKEFKAVADIGRASSIAAEANTGRCRAIPIINNKAHYYIYNDVDEIFSDEQIEEIKSLISGNFKGLKTFNFWYHNYYLNLRCFRLKKWKRIFRYYRPDIGQEPHLFDYESGQEFALQYKGVRPNTVETNLKPIGYHFSFLYSLETKLKNYGHTEWTNQISIAMQRRENKIPACFPNWKCKTIPMADIQVRDLHENIDVFKPFIVPETIGKK